MEASTVFYVIGSLLVAFLLAFLGYYTYRLLRAQDQVEESPAERFAAAMRADRDAMRGAAGPAAVAAARAAPHPVATDILPPAPSTARIYESGPSLGEISNEAVFMKRGRDGEITFQLGEKPPMPLKFLLDPRARKILMELAEQATADFGLQWGILASEEPDGRLKVMRVL